MILVGWDFETFGEHHRQHTGIFDFIGQLALELKRRKIQTVKLSDALSLAHAGRLQPPMRPVTWAGTGDLSFFLGNVRQWDLYTRMQSAYHKAIMTQRPTLIDVAMKLMQSDHLHMLHWYDTEGPEADVSSYFTPGEWWAQGKEAILEGLGRVFEEFEMALDDAVRDKVPTNYR
jgi:alpha-amylase